ncbi:copper resistance protein NlpE N-terminal domain-containing protein [uncultured Psychrobacter sp.]|uniref:copper resistance protein NlpE N-terminal domain-containing protein n=1 Tax=uncultured Psychrobacter sp. TaxID=259303 RepID=UPI00263816FE|nr:copper resistance protein NlpE N-terminal domain-containing protein [uncultured Psychrobacter sp.]
MTYLFSKFATTTAHCGFRSTLKLLLPLSICALLAGCDSHSSTPSTDKRMMIASKQSDAIAAEQETIDPNSNSEGTSSEEDESLISTAKSDRKSSIDRSSSDATTTNDSQMQATLIGDYKGVMPCSFCNSTEVLLNLFADGSVVKTSIYDNPKEPTDSLIENGIYRQDDDKITIVYDDQRIERYIIQNNHLVLLDDNNIADDDYTLSRQ